jgi:hypothetical protein
MTALDLLQQLHELGVILMPYSDGTIRCRAPKGVLTHALVESMRQHKAELHAVVEAFEEQAAIAQYCSGFPRAEAEVLAWAYILAEPVHVAVRHVDIWMSQGRHYDE